MEKPICLIENKPNGELVVREEAAEILGKIRQPMVVVAIVGPYRTGKSYLMNRLAGETKGFSLGNTVQAETKGIWMWCCPHPNRPECTLVLLDTEGLGDVEKGNTQNDSWIFALAILLSSTLVYNSTGAIDYNALEDLHYVTELSKKIKAKSFSGEDQEWESSAEFLRFFPAFIWAVRDLTLDLEVDGHPITDDEYLENALTLQQEHSEEIKKRNLPKSCIREYFPSLKCFTFDRPGGKKKLQRIEELEDHDLEEEFLEPLSRFCQHVWEKSEPKKVPGGQVVNGEMLTFLMKAYVAAIDSGELPCPENAVLALSKSESSAALKEAISHYEKYMEMRLKLPTESVEEMLEVHDTCQKEAMAIYGNRAFGEYFILYGVKLKNKLDQRKEEFCRRNEQASLDFCRAKLTELSQDLHDGIQKESFCVLGGYKHFMEKLNKIVDDYALIPGKGIQADRAFAEFWTSLEPVAKSVLQADNALSAQQKEIEAERDRVRAAQQQQKALEEQQAAMQQMMADKERSHSEHINKLKEKMEEEMQRMKEEAESMIEHKVKEKERQFKEGFEEGAKEMDKEIEYVKKNNFVTWLFQKLLLAVISYGKWIFQVFFSMGKAYRSLFKTWDIFQLQDAVREVSAIDNSAALKEVLSKYEKLMEEQTVLPTENKTQRVKHSMFSFFDSSPKDKLLD